MKKIAYCILLLVFSNFASANKKVDEWLQRADKFLLQPNVSTISEVKLFKNKKLVATKLYHVYTKESRRSLVVFMHSSEKYQKVLMKQHNFWLFLPRSKRPMRISAQQKLLGDASAGDVANVRFSDDYSGDSIKCNKAECEFLLHRKAKGSSYAKVILTLRKSDALPIKADFYLNKKRMAKSAIYHYKTKNGKQVIKAIEYYDKIQTNSHTLMTFKRIKPFNAPEKWFNPTFVASRRVIP